MTTSDSHAILSRYSRACWYSGRKPNVVRSPEQTTTSGSRSLISSMARSRRLGTKYGPPQCKSEIWAIRKQPSCIEVLQVWADPCRFSHYPFVVESKIDQGRIPCSTCF